MAEGSDVDIDLEEGELVSSGEEDAKESPVKNEEPKESVAESEGRRDTSSSMTPALCTADTQPLNTQSSIEPVSDDGEIYSDSEESAYFPNQVKSRPPPKEQKSQKQPPTRKRVSRWSDSYQSSPKRSRERDSPVRRRRRGRSESSERGDDKESSDDTSKERRSSKERRYNSPGRATDRHSSPDSKGSFHHQDRSSSGQKWSHRGGYSSSTPYQSPSHSRYGRGRGGSHGNKRLPSLSPKESHILSLQVPKRLEEGLSLLPDPKYSRNTRVDLSIYPPPPTWYLRELKAWDALHKPKPKPVPTTAQSASVPVDPSLESADTSTMAPRVPDPSLLPSLLPNPIPPPIIPTPIPLMGSLASTELIPLAESRPKQESEATWSTAGDGSNSSDYRADSAPLDPSMPFAEPLPSSHVPFAQPLPSLFQPQPQPQTATDSSTVIETSTDPSANPQTSIDSSVPQTSTDSSVPQTSSDSSNALQIVTNSTLAPQMSNTGFSADSQSSTDPSKIPQMVTDSSPAPQALDDQASSLDLAQGVDTLPANVENPLEGGVSGIEGGVVNTDESVTSGVVVRAVSMDESGSLMGRSFSVSSEVTMEIDLREELPSQSSDSSLPTPSSPIFNPPSDQPTSVPSPPLTTPTPTSTGTPPINSETTPPLITIAPPPSDATSTTTAVPADVGLSESEKAGELDPQPLADTTTDREPPQSDTLVDVLSLDTLPDQVSPPKPLEDSESVVYNLRPRADSKTSDGGREDIPGVIDGSDEEIDYDTYLDQLDDEEVPTRPTLTSSITLSSLLNDGLPKISAESGDPFSEDFPVIDKGSAPEVPIAGGDSLMSLVGGEIEEKKKGTTGQDAGSKSTKRREKELTWKAKQRQRRAASKEAAAEKDKQPRPLCKYFMNGNCKNGDKCSFSHEGPRTKKKEICKFYKQDTCNKGQDCMFYHGEFPCKFFHIKQYCRNGDNCKFSHAPLNPETEALLATVADSVTPPCNTPVHTVPPSPQPPHRQTSTDDRVQISEEGVHINMFGSTEHSESTHGLVVSIPKSISEELIVSIPLNKITDKMKFGRIPKKKFQSMAPPTSQPSSWEVTQTTPTPLFTNPSLAEQTKEPSQNPPRRVLLPTPPPHAKLTPEDIKRMENSPHEYWEAPGLLEPHPQPHPPPSGPHWRPPHEQGFRPQAPYAPRQRQPFYRPRGPRPPRPEQNWNQHSPPSQQEQNRNKSVRPEQNWNQPSEQNWSQQSHSEQNWNQQSPSEQNWSPPHPEQKPIHLEQNWDQSSHTEPNWSKSSHPERNRNKPPPHPSWSQGSGMESGPGNINRPPGGWNQRPDSRPNINSSRPGGYHAPNEGDHPQRGMDPRQSGTNPRHSTHDPRQNDPRSSQAHQGSPYYNSGTRWGQQGNVDTKYYQLSPPYSSPHGASPPSDKMSPNWKSTESAAPVSWNSSPDHLSSSKGVADATSKRVDPRKKYSHLKIKSKVAGSSSPGSGPSQSSLKKENADTISNSTGFTIPKLLTDSVSLDKPIDPKDLFGADGVDSQPYGEITFGTYKSPFTSSTDSKKGPEVADTDREASPGPESGTDTISTTGHNSIPSYLSGLGGGGGLEIESAFGSLSEKSTSKEGTEESGKSQESQARKLPSVFGF